MTILRGSTRINCVFDEAFAVQLLHDKIMTINSFFKRSGMLTVTNVQYFVLYFHHQRLHQSAHTSMIHKTKTEKYYRFMSRCQ